MPLRTYTIAIHSKSFKVKCVLALSDAIQGWYTFTICGPCGKPCLGSQFILQKELANRKTLLVVKEFRHYSDYPLLIQ